MPAQLKQAGAIYSIDKLSFYYPEQQNATLDNVSLTIKRGEFITLCGASGCGKTTLLRQLKPIMAPHGKRSGSILFEGQELAQLPQREQSALIGFVQQNPDNQIVTDKVWHELAFGLESLGFPTATIRLRVAEMASFFGIQTWFYKNVTELSGGQKQLLNLASIMAMHPSMLILDEPTSQLDPIAAADFLATVGRINRELGTTVLMTEHRLEEVLPISHRMLVMDKGRLIADGSPRLVGQQLGRDNHKMFLAMPTPMRVYAATDSKDDCPITVSEGRNWLDSYAAEHTLEYIEPVAEEEKQATPLIELKDAWFRYEKDASDVVKGASIQVHPGEFMAVLGGNGTGKTTMLSLISGLRNPYRGEVRIMDKLLSEISDKERYDSLLGTLPQNPQVLFVKKTVELDLYEMFKGRSLDKAEQRRRVRKIARLCQLETLLERHPYDLSGGEQQRAALAKVLLLQPKILLLDEPTKGLDAEFKQVFAAILQQLQAENVAILMVSHDIEFCAAYATRCALFFDGSVVTENAPAEFFSGNSFYTTSANRMVRHLLPKVVTTEELISACGGEAPPAPQLDYDYPQDEADDDDSSGGAVADSKEQKSASADSKGKSKARMLVGILALISFIITLILGFPTLRVLDLSQDVTFYLSADSSEVWRYVAVLLIMVVSAIVFFMAFFGKKSNPNTLIQMPQNKRKLPKRTIVAAAMVALLIPITLFVGSYYFNDRQYYFTSLLIIIECIIPFLMIYEGRKPQARELMVIAVLCAIAIAGRAAFFMVPQFKPVIAIVIMAAVAFGAETGFLVGALTALISNFFFGQGPWTPWQMFAIGLIGFLAGILFRKGLLRRSRVPLAIFGGLTTFLIYGGLMNPSSVLMYYNNPTWEVFVLAYLKGIPFDLIHAAATAFFLIVLSQPMLEKLDRIKVKYGLLE